MTAYRGDHVLARFAPLLAQGARANARKIASKPRPPQPPTQGGQPFGPVYQLTSTAPLSRAEKAWRRRYGAGGPPFKRPKHRGP